MEAIARARFQVVRANFDHRLALSSAAPARGDRRDREHGGDAKVESTCACRVLRSVHQDRAPPATTASPRRRATAATARAAFELARAAVAGHAPQHQVAGRERVRLVERAHRDVLRGPVADAGNGAQRLRASTRRRRRRAPSRTARASARKRRGARRDDAGFFERRIGELRGRRKQASERRWSCRSACPSAPATRPAIVVAAATEICWPRIARTVISNGSHAPGVRMPACAATARFSSAIARQLFGDHAPDRRRCRTSAARARRSPAARADRRTCTSSIKRRAVVGRRDRDRAASCRRSRSCADSGRLRRAPRPAWRGRRGTPITCGQSYGGR